MFIRLTKLIKNLSRMLLLFIMIAVLALIISSFSTAHALEFDPAEWVDMWNLIDSHCPEEQITAAFMAHMWYESFLQPNAVGGGYLTEYKDIDDYDTFITDLIDKGLADGSSREGFITHCVDGYPCWGYGLIQWVDPDECERLYDFAQEQGVSIGDADMQVEFIARSLNQRFPEVREAILNAESAGEAGVVFAHWIGGTDDGLKLQDRWWMAEKLYDTYAEWRKLEWMEIGN